MEREGKKGKKERAYQKQPLHQPRILELLLEYKSAPGEPVHEDHRRLARIADGFGPDLGAVCGGDGAGLDGSAGLVGHACKTLQ